MADEWRADEEYFHNNQSDNNFYWELKMMNVKTFSNFVLIKKILTNNIVYSSLSVRTENKQVIWSRSKPRPIESWRLWHVFIE